MNNLLRKIWFSDFLASEGSLLVLSFITKIFTPEEEILLSVAISGIFAIRYLNGLRQSGIIKASEIILVILVVASSFRVNVMLIDIIALYLFLSIIERYIKNKFLCTSSRILFSLAGYSFLFFLGGGGNVLFLFALSLHLMVITARELFYLSSLEDENAENYLDRVKKQFFIGRFIIYVFFVYSPMILALKIVKFWTFLIPIFFLIDVPYIMFISYIRISHSNKNFRRITVFMSYSIPLFYLILLIGRL